MKILCLGPTTFLTISLSGCLAEDKRFVRIKNSFPNLIPTKEYAKPSRLPYLSLSPKPLFGQRRLKATNGVRSGIAPRGVEEGQGSTKLGPSVGGPLH